MKIKTKISLILFLILMNCLTLIGQIRITPAKSKAYIPGEKLTYSLKFSGIQAGKAEIDLQQVNYQNEPVYHAKATAQTTGLAEKLYSIKDIFESYFDMNSSLPRKAIRNVKEGNYTSYCELYFNHKDTSVFSSKTDSLYKTIPGILDILSSLYYLRSLDPNCFRTGDIIHVVTFWDDEIFPFYLRYKGKEIIKTKYGKIRCHRFDPIVEPGRVFKSKDDMSAWFTDDQNFIPVKVRFELIVGSLRCDLDQYANLSSPLEVLSQ
jgi:Protein of unknown function (DUF3108)